MRRWVCAALLIVCSCSSPADNSITSYETAKSAYATSAELCDLAGAVAKDFLADGDRQKYILWDSRSKNHCYDAKYGK